MRPSVLIVDDEPQILKSLERLLQRDFDVYLFNAPIKALKFFKIHPTHIVISDMKMPEMPGEKFLESIRQLSSETKCCVMTGYADAEAAEKAINTAQVSAYFSKPWNNKQLKDKLTALSHSILDSQRQKKKFDHLSLKKRHSTVEKSALTQVIEGLLQEQADIHQRLTFKKDSVKQLVNLLVLLTASDDYMTEEHILRFASYCKALAIYIELPALDVKHIYLAAILLRVGFVGREFFKEHNSLNNLLREDEVVFQRSILKSSQLLETVDFLVPSARILNILSNNFFSIKKDAEDDYNSKLVKVVYYFYLALTGQLTGEVMSMDRTFAFLSSYEKTLLDFSLLRKLNEVMLQSERVGIDKPVLVGSLREGMVTTEDLFHENGQLLLSKHTMITQEYIEQLQTVEENANCQFLLFVELKES